MSESSPEAARVGRIWSGALAKVAFADLVWCATEGFIAGCLLAFACLAAAVLCINVWLWKESDLR